MIIGPKPETATGDAVSAMLDRVQAVPFPAAYEIRESEEHRAKVNSGSDAEVAQEELRPPVPASHGNSWRVAALSALFGAVAGGAAVLAAISYGPAASLLPADPRLDGIERRLGAAELRLGDSADAIDRLAVDVASALDRGEEVSERIAIQQQETTSLRKDFAALGEARSPGAEERLPVLAVAVSQLRAAFASGAPFETELVNVYNLSRSDSALVPLLTELLGPARDGVANSVVLRGQLHSLVSASANPQLRIGLAQSYYDYGMALVNEYIGVASEPYAVEHANLALTEADRRLQRGDVSGAVSALADVDPQILRSLTPFLDAARLHERVNAAMQELNDMAALDLRDMAARDGEGG